MKKLIAIISSFSMVASMASISATVNSCTTIKEAVELKYKNLKSDKDVIDLLTNKEKVNIFPNGKPLIIKDNKLNDDYDKPYDDIAATGLHVAKINESLIQFASKEHFNYLGYDLNDIFEDVESLKAEQSHEDYNAKWKLYFATINGKKGEASFMLNIYTFDLDINSIKFGAHKSEKVYYRTINLVSDQKSAVNK
ncbi:hypothetical protein SHELI_v1c03600 [Spiroplasma helicoides]|uniref:Lipoprotein n=1 Tax=Spiroplasma helicoides TaxID=216938 RepID=A0A1B3SK65_9MOLU|nr:hypothetical protein [Spiroplasma helicoides]AOG60315.1 hypothetical protein SHELI_v1c03600 [Spiroplasma helicoides]